MAKIPHLHHIRCLDKKEVMDLAHPRQIGVLSPKTVPPGQNFVAIFYEGSSQGITERFQFRDGEDISLFVGIGNVGEKTIWGKLGVTCNKKTEAYEVNLTIADHLCCPGEEVLILISARCIVEEDADAAYPWMNDSDLVPIRGEER